MLVRACGGKRLGWPIARSDKRVGAFRLLSRSKYGGYMDGWEDHLSLAIAQCKDCKHTWHHTCPSQKALFGMYANGIRLSGRPASTQPTPRMLYSMRGLHEYCLSWGSSQPTLLDYGSGAGRWANASHQAGFHVTAYEPVSNRAGTDGGIELVFALDKLGDRRFDIINLEQVLEHLPDPAATLRDLQRYCHQRTVLRISVPDLQRLGTKLWKGFPFDGKSVHILSPYEHIHGFRRSSLLALLREVGMQPCTDWRLLFCLPRYSLERVAIRFGSPFARTAILAHYLV
jgi:hypothetical protein